VPPPAPPPQARSSDVSPFGVVLGIALLGGMLLIGVLLGRGTDNSSDSTPQVVTVSSETAGGSTTSSPGSNATGTPSSPATSSPPTNGTGAPTGSGGETVQSDWPAGKEGWTIQLATLPKDGTSASDVESTSQSYSDEGTKDVGVLDTDLYPSLLPASYVIYSGVFNTRADAEAALKKLGSKAPGAAVVEVSSQAAAPGNTGSPEAEVK
jgi:hypothetical protein